MFLIFISCIIISDLSRRKVAVETTSLIQKSLNFSIFLLSSKITLKIINFLNFLTPTIFLRAINVSSMFDSHVKTIISAALILCIRFISCFFLIHVISFISLLDLHFEKAPISRRKNVEIATLDYLTIIFIQVLSSIVSFVFSTTLFNFLIIFFNLITCLSKQSLAFFASLAHSWRVASLIMSKNLVIIVHDIIFDRFFSFDL